MRRAILAAGWIVLVAAHPTRTYDRRVVDTVDVGDPTSDVLHGYAGHDDRTRVVDGKPARTTRGWLLYALTTFDDTEVTIACTFVGTESGNYDVVVDDSLIASKRFEATTGLPTVVEIPVPFGVTKGKSTIAVMLRARGGPTPPLRALRTIQDHNEVSQLAVVQQYENPLLSPLGVAR